MRKLNWQLFLAYLAIFALCGAAWYGIYKFVQLIAKAQGW